MTRAGWLAALPAVVLLVAGCSDDTQVEGVTVPGPTAPAWVHVSMTTPDSLRLSWTDQATTEAGYEVLRSLRMDDGYTPIDTLDIDAAGFTDTAVEAGERYYYRVRGFDQIGRPGDLTEPVWGVAEQNEPPIFDLEPGAIQPETGSLGLMSVTRLAWSASDPDGDPVHFRVHYSDSRVTLEENLVATADSSTYRLVTTPEFTRFYYWRVAAYDDYGATTLSPTFSFGMRVEHIDVPAGYFVRGNCGLLYPEDPHTYCPEDRVAWVDDFNMDRFEVSNQLFAQFLQERIDGRWVIVENGLVVTNNPEAILYAKVYPDGDEHAGLTYDPNQGENGAFLPRPGRENHPVVEVSWHGAKAFAEFFGRRLPSELEWEKAARGTLSTVEDTLVVIDDTTSVLVGFGTAYPWGSDSDPRRYNYSGSGDPFDVRVGVSTTEGGFYDGRNRGGYATEDGSSIYGAYDLAGNVAEWCQDTAIPYHGGANMGMKVVKGGGWRSTPIACQTFWRQAAFPDSSDNNIGFRTVGTGLENEP